MRRKIIKSGHGIRTEQGKEVLLRINKSGLNAKGEQRYVIALRFTSDSYKKASNTEFVSVEMDDDLNRMYFLSSDSKEGFKLSGNDGKAKSISFTINNEEEWLDKVGDYILLKDVDEGLYYIDFGKKENRGGRA